MKISAQNLVNIYESSLVINSQTLGTTNKISKQYYIIIKKSMDS